MRTIEHGTHDSRGDPGAILHLSNVGLNNRQRLLLDTLSKEGDEVTVKKSAVSMVDLSALTALENVEFAMFTKGSERLIVRGNYHGVSISDDRLKRMNAQGYKWSGHTHPGLNLMPSGQDIDALNNFDQNSSVIYNARGEFFRFYKKVKRRI